MYLDHLKNNAGCVDVNAATFADCMEAALYCTEVHSAADAYLIKAEAEYMAKASEGEETAAKEGWWTKIKVAIRKMWEVVKNLAAKVISFIKNLPSKIADVARKLITSLKSIGLYEKLKKAKDEGWVQTSKPEKKYMDFEKINASDVLSSVNTARLKIAEPYFANLSKNTGTDVDAEMKSAREKFDGFLKDFKDKVDNENSDWYKPVADMKLDEACMWAANLGADKWKNVNTQYANAMQGASKVTQLADKATKEFASAYQNKDEDKVKKITKCLSICRSLEVMYSTGSSAFASAHLRWYYKMAGALRALASSYSPKKAEEKK